MPVLPTGTVTFLFTDIEGSTRLVQELGERYRAVQHDHGAIMRRAIAESDGVEVDTAGDSFFAVFRSPVLAVRAAVAAQRGLAGHTWTHGRPLTVRMGVHTGEGTLGGDSYVGIDVNRAARIAAAGHGGQVLLSDATRGLVERNLPEGVSVRDLARHRLKDLAHTERLFQLVIDGLPSDFPELKSMDARPNNLPLQLTSFVGREREIAETAELLTGHRLVTLTGPGGTGKTRLALEVVTGELTRLADGAFFVELAPIVDPAQVLPAVAQALAVREAPGRKLVDTLTDHLAGKELLLLLDNFEHVLEAAPLVDDLLGAVAGLRILVTSRTPLRLYGEQEQPVPPLGLPDLRSLPEVEGLSQYEAVALFIERARAARPDFAVTNESAPAVAEICARLDGLPLAIELAASRIKVLSPQAILSRLGGRLDLLTATARNMPERQRTLRGAIEWSFGLLDEAERRLFARLSVFAGGADLEAASDVANPGGDIGLDTLDGLSSLLDKSLIRETDSQEAEPRFGMLETIRDFARERLDEEMDSDATRRRHADHFLALAEESEPHLTGKDQVAWLDRLDREHDNVQAALRWTVEAGEAYRGMLAAAAIWRFWHQRAHLAVGRAWLEQLLALPDAGQAAARARAHGAAGSVAYWQTDYQGTERHYQEALEIYRELDDRQGVAGALYNLAFVPILRGTELDRSLRLLEEAREIYWQADDRDAATRAVHDIAFVHMMQGQYESALPLMEEAAAWSRERGDTFRLADDLMGLGQAHRLLGNHEQARAAYLESLDTLEKADVPVGIASLAQMMAALESALGHHERAVRLFGAAAAINEEIGGSYPPAAAMSGDPVGDARRAIGDEAVDRALAEGRGMKTEETIAYAREQSST